jgi:hypothetical protein
MFSFAVCECEYVAVPLPPVPKSYLTSSRSSSLSSQIPVINFTPSQPYAPLLQPSGAAAEQDNDSDIKALKEATSVNDKTDEYCVNLLKKICINQRRSSNLKLPVEKIDAQGRIIFLLTEYKPKKRGKNSIILAGSPALVVGYYNSEVETKEYNRTRNFNFGGRATILDTGKVKQLKGVILSLGYITVKMFWFIF